MAVIDGLPDAPQYFKHNAKMNHDGPPLVDWDKTTPPALPAADVLALSQKGAWMIDVRDARAFAAAHPCSALSIGNVLNIPINKMFAESKRLSKDMPVLTVCNSAYRSSMGASVLLKQGFKEVFNMEGGSEAWIAAGLPTLGATGGGHGAAAVPARTVRLPDRIAAADLKRLLMDLPGTFEIVDVRPPAQFTDFNIHGSMNADIADVIANPAYLNGAVLLVLVDRDGSLAMAVGGIRLSGNVCDAVCCATTPRS